MEPNLLKILLIENDADSARRIKEVLEQGRGVGGRGNIDRLQAEASRVPVIVRGHLDDEAVALEAVHEGAQDYLVRSQLNPQFLSRAIRYAVERERADAALLEAEEKYRGIFEHIVEGIFQTSP